LVLQTIGKGAVIIPFWPFWRQSAFCSPAAGDGGHGQRVASRAGGGMDLASVHSAPGACGKAGAEEQGLHRVLANDC